MRSSIWLFFILLSGSIFAQQQLQFDHLDMPLTPSHLLQDRQGFIWFTTNLGLVRYDGYEFKTFPPNNYDSTAFQGGVISDIFEDHHGNLWIGTWNGRLYNFNPQTEHFKYYDPDSNDTTALQGQRTYDILELSPYKDKRIKKACRLPMMVCLEWLFPEMGHPCSLPRSRRNGPGSPFAIPLLSGE